MDAENKQIRIQSGDDMSDLTDASYYCYDQTVFQNRLMLREWSAVHQMCVHGLLSHCGFRRAQESSF